ncbi:glycosyltransferase family 2 protein [Pseudomonas argentinensis]|uniref:Glycosyltransferase involved in cell wall bisynthesis n=1 Tax=Phytopseudomonas argentinensis TaxID=289370 RepID=A0A1I3L0C8_9GAMM|nr:glycosyltransferase family 2 protein [Pseudomonas argentinensis]KAB0550291.1 glycosyltransferase family 2 protein [Pseudomonas argentinensis]SFI78173.1 Glycosyltransferase involved in cell wall bisynthesis [Pseudomonas argentinensis]
MSVEYPLVSVLVPVYKQQDLISETVESILAQNYPSIEILISDDASPDSSANVINGLAARYPTVRSFAQEKNLGITANYNFLASKAIGKYIAIFSGDDLMMPGKIAAQVDALEQNPDSSFCHHAVYDMAPSGKIRGIIDHFYEDGVTTIKDVLNNLGIPGSMTILYRASSSPQPPFEPSIPTASDWLNMIDLCARGRGIYLDTPFVCYRRDDSYNGKDPTRYEGDFIKTLELALHRYAYSHPEIGAACDFALARFYLGAGYRRLYLGHVKIAREYFLLAATQKSLKPKAMALWLISYFPVRPSLLLRMKKIYKKMVSAA